MGVHKVFLHGDLKEEVYKKLSLGYHSLDPSKVCYLCKSLYRLEEAPHRWFAKFSTALKQLVTLRVIIIISYFL